MIQSLSAALRWIGQPKARAHSPMRRVEMRMRDGDRLDAAEALDHASRSRRRAWRRNPTEYCRRACAPAARAGRWQSRAASRCRSRPARIRGSCSCGSSRSASSVVQLWPRGGTYCRSSSQMTAVRGRLVARRILRAAGGADESGHEVLSVADCGRASLLLDLREAIGGNHGSQSLHAAAHRRAGRRRHRQHCSGSARWCSGG